MYNRMHLNISGKQHNHEFTIDKNNDCLLTIINLTSASMRQIDREEHFFYIKKVERVLFEKAYLEKDQETWW